MDDMRESENRVTTLDQWIEWRAKFFVGFKANLFREHYFKRLLDGTAVIVSDGDGYALSIRSATDASGLIASFSKPYPRRDILERVVAHTRRVNQEQDRHNAVVLVAPSQKLDLERVNDWLRKVGRTYDRTIDAVEAAKRAALQYNEAIDRVVSDSKDEYEFLAEDRRLMQSFPDPPDDDSPRFDIDHPDFL